MASSWSCGSPVLRSMICSRAADLLDDDARGGDLRHLLASERDQDMEGAALHRFPRFLFFRATPPRGVSFTPDRIPASSAMLAVVVMAR